MVFRIKKYTQGVRGFLEGRECALLFQTCRKLLADFGHVSLQPGLQEEPTLQMAWADLRNPVRLFLTWRGIEFNPVLSKSLPRNEGNPKGKG